MPFLGTTPTQGFVSSVEKQSFTPNGILTSFTLNHPVSNANDLEVFVGNVRQEPTAAYTAAGTTLDFGAGNAPPSGANFYVIYKNQAQVTTTPPDGSVSNSKIASGISSSKLTGALPALDGSALTGISSSYAIICDEKADGVNAGQAGAGTHNRDLNTKVYDPDNIVTLHSTTQFRLSAGTYIIEWSAPAYKVDSHVTWLYDVNNGSTVSMGSIEYSASSSAAQTRSMGSVGVTISTDTNYRIQHYCTSAKTNNGLGVGASAGFVNRFTIVKIIKVS